MLLIIVSREYNLFTVDLERIMKGAIARALFGQPRVRSRWQNPLTLIKKENTVLGKDSFLGAIEQRSHSASGGNQIKRLHVRSIDGAEYSVIENDVSRTIEKIHGLLHGKVIEVSGQIDRETKAVLISKLRVVPVQRKRDGKEQDSWSMDDPDLIPRMP